MDPNTNQITASWVNSDTTTVITTIFYDPVASEFRMSGSKGDAETPTDGIGLTGDYGSSSTETSLSTENTQVVVSPVGDR